ncbi:MAG: hypothetical protein RLY86_2614 [Pseudomonadota bacterium]
MAAGALLALAGLVPGMTPGVALAVGTAAPPPVEAYAGPALAADLALSPDGTHVAFLAPHQGKHHMVIRPLAPDAAAQPVLIPPGEFRFAGLSWVNDRTLIFTLIGTEEVFVSGPNRKIPVRYSRILAVERDGSNLRLLYEPKYAPGFYNVTSGQILQYIDDDHILMQVPHERGQRIIRLNVNTGKAETQDRTGRMDLSYMPDPTGQVRIASRLDDRSGKQIFLFRKGPDEPFEELKRLDALKDPAFEPLGFGADGTLYVASNHESDKIAIYTYDIATQTFGQKVLSDPQVDVGGAVMERGTVIGFTYLQDMPVRVFLDPQIQRLQEVLDKAIPDSREILLEQTRDGRFTLLASFHPALPTIFRLFDSQTKQLMPFADTFPNIPESALATRQAISYQARDGLTIPGYLTLPPGREPKNLPFIVLPHGGPIARDTQTFDTLSQFLASRGYAVLQPNFRGSSGYGTAFLTAGFGQWGLSMQTDVTDGVKWAIAQGIADPARICIVGWSYGGYAALMGAVQDSGLYRCAIATAPVANLERLWRELRWSTNYTEFNRSLFFKDDRASLRPVSPVQQAERIGIPVMLIHGDLDVQAFIQHSRDMVDALEDANKPHEFIEIKGMDHSAETTQQMVTVLTAWERFLKQHIGN